MANIKEVERINDLINEAELENAKNLGILENIKNTWEENYGFNDLESAKNKLSELKEELKASNERLEKIYNELLNAYDWDALEEELN